MYLIQLLLPLYDNTGEPFPRDLYRSVKNELAERFGGLTAYTRAPAEGLWLEAPTRTTRDDIVIYEVMTDTVERPWWDTYRLRLETLFRQQHIVIRVQPIEVI